MANNEQTTAQRELFLEYLFNDPECNNNSLLAARKAGYSDGYHAKLVRDARDDILQRAELELAKAAPKAVQKLVEAMDEDGTVPKGELRLKAVDSILDRIGVAKKQDIGVQVDTSSPLFMIPSKVECQLTKQTDEED